MSDFPNIVTLRHRKPDGTPPFAIPSSPEEEIDDSVGLVIFLLGVGLCLAGMVVLVFTSIGTALLLLAGLGLALSGKRLMEVADD